VRTKQSERWVRGFVGDVVVVDTRRPLLFWEDAFPVPSYAFDPADVRTELLSPSAGADAATPFFFQPKGPVSQWFDLTVDGRVVPHAAWLRDDPALQDRLVLSWQPGLLDRWLEEDQEVRSHPRDPHKRVDALPSSRHVVVRRAGQVLADSVHPVALFETGLPTRFYLPREDVRLDVLVRGTHESHCPYKGFARTYWDLPAGVGNHDPIAGIAWSYADPDPAVSAIADRVAFYDELVDVEVDGVPRQRPRTMFSDESNRPRTA
jgi:uncharacterized protein (DUF427 family)